MTGTTQDTQPTFAQEYRVLRAVIRRYAGRYSSLTTAVDVEDLAQEGLLAAWKAMESGQGRQYALAASKGAMVDYLRSHGPKTRTGVLRPTAIDPHELWDLDWADESAPLEEVEQTDHALWILSHLQGRQREVIERTVLGDSYLHELASEWGVAESRVCQIRNTAIKRLRLAMGVPQVSTRGIGNARARRGGAAVADLAQWRRRAA